MFNWSQFEQVNPALAAFGRERLSSRVAYLATVRADGSPRVHPVTPIIGGGRLYLYMEPTSPKGHDLRRDSRYALHCSVENWEGGGGEFVIHGRAVLITDAQTRAEYDTYATYEPKARYILFELLLERVLSTTYPNGTPIRQRWSHFDPPRA
ncbi:MAG: pyridoxamine 5'-phosphate oxidase [Chloroflexi bacterium CFX4]|nr:pyridoxamine 5'-phosphate oxidase [Chloroflexi bacterium CFX4]MDL1921337.1 pyridoxamine 5'-phosphate oxidase [Chloroflexi bacterium CFX3]